MHDRGWAQPGNIAGSLQGGVVLEKSGREKPYYFVGFDKVEVKKSRWPAGHTGTIFRRDVEICC